MSRYDGYFTQLYLTEYLVHHFGLNQHAWSVYEYMLMLADNCTGIILSSSAQQISLRRKINNLDVVKRAQRDLKRCGLIHFNRAANSGHKYFVAYKMLEKDNIKGFRITRPWNQLLAIAKHKKLIPGKHPDRELFDCITKEYWPEVHPWPDLVNMRVVDPHANLILSPPRFKKVQPSRGVTKVAAEIIPIVDDDQHERNMERLADIDLIINNHESGDNAISAD